MWRAMLVSLCLFGLASVDAVAASRIKDIAVLQGARIDVTVSSLGDASSLGGGQLVMTPLLGADGQIYAVAQGPVSISGFLAEGEAETVTQGAPTSGRIAGGAIVEREVPVNFDREGAFILQLRNPDFSTAIAVTDAINDFAKSEFGGPAADEMDSRTVKLKKPDGMSPARFIAAIENLTVETDQPARVVLDEKSGTVVIGADVRVSRVAVSHGALTVRITEVPTVVQPLPFSDGVTAVEPSTFIDINEEGTQIGTIDGVDLQSLVEGLNRLGVQPRDIIAILQSIKSAGALNAELVVQ